MVNTLRLGFNTDSGKKAFFTVPFPKSGLTGPQVKAQMQAIAALDIVRLPAGRLAAPLSATLISVDETKFDVS